LKPVIILTLRNKEFKMSKLLITTQVFENYGVRWKAKGGSDYVVLGVDECDMIDVIVDRARAKIECDNEAFREYVIGYTVVADDYLTEFEQQQLEWDGRIAYPAQVVEV
jgi:hypothetical protein